MQRDKNKVFPLAINYQNIRHELDTGDIVIFGGHYRLSKLIRLWTRFPASHVGMIIRDGTRIRFVEASEGDMYPEREGVIVNYFSNSIPFYKGDIWIARLSSEIRTEKRLDVEKTDQFLMDQVGKRFDYEQMKKAGLDFFDRIGITKNKEKSDKFFCSELVAAALKNAGILPQSVNTSEISPADIIKLRIFNPVYYQIKAYNHKAVKLPGFNTVDPLKS